jgi:hypothetical protein
MKRKVKEKSELEHGAAAKPISLAPLSLDEAMRGLLAVKPPPKGVKPTPEKVRQREKAAKTPGRKKLAKK